MPQQTFIRMLGLVCVVLPALSFAVEDCTPYLAALDAKIAAAAQAGHNVAMANEIRDSVVEACPFIDAASLEQMVASLDAIFPAMSEFADLQAQMEAQAVEVDPPAPPQARPPAAASALPLIGRSLGAQHIDRPDRMHQFAIWDLDLHQGAARALYHTRPDRLQFAQPDWEFVIYTVEVSADGHATQRLITRRQASDHAALALRRGENEVLLQRVATSDGSDAHIERWTIGSSSMASRVPVPSPRWPDGEQRYWGPFFGPTSDGNLFFASVAPENRSTTEHTMAWFKATPDGRVLGQGSLTRDDSMAPNPSIIADAGRGAMMLTVSSDAGSGIETRLDVPIAREVAGREVRAAVAMEKRLFVVGADGRSFAESPALERMLVWLGDMGVPQDLTAAEMLRQSQLQMAMMAETDRAVDAGRQVVSLDRGLRRIEMVEPMRGDRFAALVKVTDDRSLDPPNHGAYLLTVDARAISEVLYLEPLAEALDAGFKLLAVSPGDEIYLYAESSNRSDDRVIRVNASGRVEGYAPVSAPMNIAVEGLVAGEAGVWVFGRGFIDGKIGDRIWVERLAFDV